MYFNIYLKKMNFNIYLISIGILFISNGIYLYNFEKIWTNKLKNKLKKNIILILKIIFNLTIIGIIIFINKFYIINYFLIIFLIFDFIFIIYNILNIYKLFKQKNIQIDNKKINIICLIPCYNEKKNLVLKNINSLCKQNKNNLKNIKIDLLIICDGLVERNNTTLFDELKEELNVDEEIFKIMKYKNWQNDELNEIIILKTKYKDSNIFLSYKKKNYGKKDTLIIGEEIINDMNYDYIYHTDADTFSDENCIINLLNTLEQNKELTAVSGILKVYYNWDYNKNYLNNFIKYIFSQFQEYQYFYSIIVKRLFFSNLNQTICLPGCCNLVKITDKTKLALELYKSKPDYDNYIDLISSMQGTDKKYTSCLLYYGCKSNLNIFSYVYTEPPKTHTKFINQRRRWSSNTFFNSFILLKYKNVHYIIKLFIFFQIFKMYLTIFKLFIFLFYFYNIFFIQQIDYFKLSINFIKDYNIIYFLILIPIIYTHIIGFIFIKKYYKTFFSFIINIFFFWMSFIYQYIILKMLATTTNFSWNKMKVENEHKTIEIVIK